MDRWTEVLKALEDARELLLLVANDAGLMEAGGTPAGGYFNRKVAEAYVNIMAAHDHAAYISGRLREATTEGKTDGK